MVRQRFVVFWRVLGEKLKRRLAHLLVTEVDGVRDLPRRHPEEVSVAQLGEPLLHQDLQR